MKEECSYCGKEAVYETPILGIFVCERDKCKIAFCEDQFESLEETEE